MKILLFIIDGVIAFIIYAIYSGTKREHAYQQIIAELQQQLTQNPVNFFLPKFHMQPNSYS